MDIQSTRRTPNKALLDLHTVLAVPVLALRLAWNATRLVTDPPAALAGWPYPIVDEVNIPTQRLIYSSGHAVNKRPINTHRSAETKLSEVH
jgi:hypothetical protein